MRLITCPRRNFLPEHIAVNFRHMFIHSFIFTQSDARTKIMIIITISLLSDDYCRIESIVTYVLILFFRTERVSLHCVITNYVVLSWPLVSPIRREEERQSAGCWTVN